MAKAIKETKSTETKSPVLKEGIDFFDNRPVDEKVLNFTASQEVMEEPKKEEPTVVVINESPENPKVETLNVEKVKEILAEKTFEEKIIDFVESRPTSEFRLNDFLKSLYGVPVANMPAKHLDIVELKNLKAILTKLDNEGAVKFTTNSYQQLGKTFYDDNKPESLRYNLNNLNIFVKK